ncbi:hypothetical protein [Streptomyces decoyicus]|nr:hypothetical protein OG532_25715 [Streptomyces decoyicus]
MHAVLDAAPLHPGRPIPLRRSPAPAADPAPAAATGPAGKACRS